MSWKLFHSVKILARGTLCWIPFSMWGTANNVIERGVVGRKMKLPSLISVRFGKAGSRVNFNLFFFYQTTNHFSCKSNYGTAAQSKDSRTFIAESDREKNKGGLATRNFLFLLYFKSLRGSQGPRFFNNAPSISTLMISHKSRVEELSAQANVTFHASPPWGKSPSHRLREPIWDSMEVPFPAPVWHEKHDCSFLEAHKY